MRDAAECDDGAELWQRGQRAFEERAAGADFLGRRPVARRQAFDGIEDDKAFGGVFRKAMLGECGPEEIARGVPLKGQPRAVGTMEAGCQPDNCKPRVCIAEGRNGRIPIIGMGGATLLTMPGKTGAERTIALWLSVRNRAFHTDHLC